METVAIYVLIVSKLLKNNEISDHVVGVTTDLAEAETHIAKGIEFESRKFFIDIEMGVEASAFMEVIREFKRTANSVNKVIEEVRCQNNIRSAHCKHCDEPIYLVPSVPMATHENMRDNIYLHSRTHSIFCETAAAEPSQEAV